MINKVILLGNVGRDPEIRRTQSGGKFASLSLATSESWKDKRSGERVEKTEWHRVVIFSDALCDLVEKYVTKGRPIYVEGALQTREWQDQHGEKRFTTEVVLKQYGGVIKLLGGGRRDDDRSNEPAEKPSYNGDEVPF